MSASNVLSPNKSKSLFDSKSASNILSQPNVKDDVLPDESLGGLSKKYKINTVDRSYGNVIRKNSRKSSLHEEKMKT